MAEQEKKMTIDQCLNQIEELIAKLEADDISLEQSFELYNKGISLVKDCNDKIDNVEKKIKIIESNTGE